MTVALRRTMTQDAFFRWAEGRDERHEFDGSQPVAMTGGSRNHARIVGNIGFALRQHLGSGPCEALTSDAGIETINNGVRYPDALVTCTASDGCGRLIPDPVIVFEVISPSSVREDRILKPREYAAVPSIRRYVIVEQSVIGLTVLWRHEAEPWHFETLKSGDLLVLPEIGGAGIPVDALYDRVTFEQDQSSG